MKARKPVGLTVPYREVGYEEKKEKREWVGLNWSDMPNEWVGKVAFMEGAKWAEAKLKEKNS